MVVYAGLPPAIPIWQEERNKKNKFVHWLRSNGFLAVTKDCSPADEGPCSTRRSVAAQLATVRFAPTKQRD